jgi:hypothetical protein
MNTKKTAALGVVIILILAGLTWAIVIYYPSMNNNQPQDTYVPTLQQDLQLVDNRTNSHAPFLHVTGTIQNTGNGTANNITMHVYAIQSGNATALDTTRGLASIAAGATQTVDLMFSYTGEALVAYYEPTLEWTN